jgi:hypothetical protein
MSPLLAEVLRLQSGAHTFYSVLVLLTSLAGLTCGLFAFAHARLMSADLREIDRLHSEGLLRAGASLEEDYRELTYMVDTIAPAVYMRQEIWVKLYYVLLRTSKAFARYSDVLDREMQRLVAHQCGNYREACARLAEIRAIS